jgi:hypothetical protein
MRRRLNQKAWCQEQSHQNAENSGRSFSIFFLGALKDLLPVVVGATSRTMNKRSFGVYAVSPH